MKPSPIQLLQVLFRHVRVEVDAHHMPAEPPNPLISVFVFDGVNIQSKFGIAELDPDCERGRMFVVTLRVIIDNKPNANLADQKFSPYLIDVEAQGVIVVLKGAEKLAPPEDLVKVNGASLLWSSMREQVLTVTSRMPAGGVILPTVNFQELKSKPSPAEDGPERATESVIVPTRKPAARGKASSKGKR